ncbi:MAG: hypothetical protein Q7T55_04425 [Solirubrobacteraceae bacterium]|nr:hypothetical protein [Solirubrobacteraceae bacterium]
MSTAPPRPADTTDGRSAAIAAPRPTGAGASVCAGATLAATILLATGLSGCGPDVDAKAAATSPPAISPPADLPTARPVLASVDDLAFDPSGRLLALDRGKVAEVDAQGKLGRRESLIRGKRASSASGGGFSPDASAVAVFVGLSVRVVSRASGRVRWTADQPGSVYDQPQAFWSTDASRLLIEADGPALALDARTGKRLRSIRGFSGYFGRHSFSPKGRSVVVGAGHGVTMVSVGSGEKRVLPKVERIDREPGLDRPAWSPDGKLIAGTGGMALDLATGRFRRLGTSRSGTEVAWSPDGRWLATFGVLEDDADEDAGLSVVDVASGEETVLARGGAREERGELAWSADSRQVAYVSPPGSPCAEESGGGDLC